MHSAKLNQYENIPLSLKQQLSWVCFELVDGKKLPRNPHKPSRLASVNNESTHSGFEKAMQVAIQHGWEIAFLLKNSDELVCIDVDSCFDNGYNEIATSLLKTFANTYIEKSVSGRGLHIICRGKIPYAGRKNPAVNIEIYQSGRFIICTGNTINSTEPVVMQTELDNLYSTYFKKDELKKGDVLVSPLLSDYEIIDRAKNAKNGSKFDALMRGDISQYNHDDSAADQALCNMLAFWTQDPEQIKRIVASSGLKRKKWERNDYSSRTIDKSLSMVKETYQENKTMLKSNQEPIIKIKVESRRYNLNPAQSLIKEPPKEEWLVKDLLGVGSLNEIFGAPGSMKSFLALDISCCIATEMPWNGRDIKNPGPVFYLAGEGFAGIGKRIKAWVEYNQVDPEMLNLFVSNGSANINDPECFKEVVEEIEDMTAQHGNPSLIVIDTLSRNFGPGDENKAEDMSKFIKMIETFFMKEKTSVLIIHHTPLHSQERARGSSVLHGALDFDYLLRKNNDGSRTLVCKKAKDHDQSGEITLMPHVVELSWRDSDGEPMTSCVLKEVVETEPELNIYEALKKESTPKVRGIPAICHKVLEGMCKLSPTGRVDVNEWKEGCKRSGISAGEMANLSSKFSRAYLRLLDLKLIDVLDEQFWVIAPNKK